MRKIFIVVILFCTLFMISSCGIYSNPNSLITSPKLNGKDISTNDNTDDIIRKFLPNEFKVLSKDEIATSKSIEFIDIDNDKNNEIIAFIEKDDTKGFMILKNSGGLWQKEYQKLLKCEFITNFAFLNVFDTSKKSIIIGFSINSNIGAEYDVYTYEDDGIEERNIGTWNKFDIVKNLEVDGNEFTIAGWRKYGYDYLIVDFIKLDGKGAYLSNDYYPEYYNKSIEYYNNMLNDMLKYKGPTYFAWYGIVRTEIRSGNAEKALNELETVNQIKGYFPLTDAITDLLKAQTYIKLNKFNEAQETLDIAIVKENNDANNKNFIDETYRDLAYMYIENARLSEKLSNKEKAEEMLKKASDIFNQLDKNNYYHTGGAEMKFYKELDLNTINNEHRKLNKNDK